MFMLSFGFQVPLWMLFFCCCFCDWRKSSVYQRHFSHEGLIHKTRIKRNANDVFLLTSTAVINLIALKFLPTLFERIADRFLQSAFSIPLIYGFLKYYFKFMESASTLKCHCELFDDEFQFLFRDILPDAVESNFDSLLWEEINP